MRPCERQRWAPIGQQHQLVVRAVVAVALLSALPISISPLVGASESPDRDCCEPLYPFIVPTKFPPGSDINRHGFATSVPDIGK